MTAASVIIVGAGLAGVSAALALRQAGFAAPIRLYSEEDEWPYDRPPLSKSFAGANGPPLATLLSEEQAAANALDVTRGTAVSLIEANTRRLRLSDGRQDAYGALILATGGTAKAMPGLAVDNTRVFSLRTYADARVISEALTRAHSLAVIGGGWLGLEIAAAASIMGRRVSVFEAAPSLCPRSLPHEVGEQLRRMHEAHGVRIVTRSDAGFAREGSQILARHADGRIDRFDIAVIAIGLIPRIELASTAGIACDDGILTDGAGRTSHAGIYAVGDAARPHHDGMRRRLRLESWTNAAVQGALAAQAIHGARPRYTTAPWFWSEQFGRMVQVAGMPRPDLLLMSTEDGDRPLWRYGQNGRLAAVIGIDRAKDVRAASRLLTADLESAVDAPLGELSYQAHS